MEKKERSTALDVARTLAVLDVVMIHATADFLGYYDVGTPEFFWGSLFSGLARVGVPLFVMISGALLLDEDRAVTMRGLVGKNVKSLALLLVFWSAVYDLRMQIVAPLLRGEAVSKRAVVEKLLLGQSHLWYLYMIIGMYLVTPFLRCFLRREDPAPARWFIALGLVAQFTGPVVTMLATLWEPLGVLSQLIGRFELKFFGGYTVYYVTGWYLVHVGLPKRLGRAVPVLGALAAIISILYVGRTGDYNTGYSPLNLLIYCYAVGVFCLLLRLPSFGERAMERLSRLTLGVYLVQSMVLYEMKRLVPYGGRPLRYVLALWLGTCCLSFALCYLASKNRFTRKLIRA
jgi:surface polysaccharide O-acyltransferase-like enzyme